MSKPGRFKAATLEKKHNRIGYVFVMPIIIGIILIFLPLLVQSFLFSINNIKIISQGFELEHVGLEHYNRAVAIDPNFRRMLIDSVTRMLIDVPVIVIFSFFMANVLNQKFRGRIVARVIFFLPVILATGIIASVESSDMLLNLYRGGGGLDTGVSSNIFRYNELRQILLDSQFNQSVISIIIGAIDGLYNIITSSGVQMLIFLAGLQSLPSSVFEAAKVEGATGWECFWKITFPMISPLILVSIIYTIIHSFTSANNGLINHIRNVSALSNQYGLASAMSWIYFAVVAIVLLIAGLIINKVIIYQD